MHEFVKNELHVQGVVEEFDVLFFGHLCQCLDGCIVRQVFGAKVV